MPTLEEKLKRAAQNPDAKSLFSGSQEGLLNPTSAELSTASLTNRDQFEDEFAFRDAVHARKRERVLDDTHDLAGLTLYEMKFDAAITPGDNARQKALIEIQMDPEPLEPSEYGTPGFIERQRDSTLYILAPWLWLGAGHPYGY